MCFTHSPTPILAFDSSSKALVGKKQSCNFFYTHVPETEKTQYLAYTSYLSVNGILLNFFSASLKKAVSGIKNT